MKSIEVAQLSNDGNSLFEAIAHQLFACQPSDLTDLANYLATKFMSPLVVDPQQKLTAALLEAFSDPKTSMVLLTAISKIFKVNILVICENGPIFFLNGFNQEYYRYACLTHRLKSGSDNRKKFRFDSVISIHDAKADANKVNKSINRNRNQSEI